MLQSAKQELILALEQGQAESVRATIKKILESGTGVTAIENALAATKDGAKAPALYWALRNETEETKQTGKAQAVTAYIEAILAADEAILPRNTKIELLQAKGFKQSAADLDRARGMLHQPSPFSRGLDDVFSHSGNRTTLRAFVTAIATCTQLLDHEKIALLQTNSNETDSSLFIFLGDIWLPMKQELVQAYYEPILESQLPTPMKTYLLNAKNKEGESWLEHTPRPRYLHNYARTCFKAGHALADTQMEIIRHYAKLALAPIDQEQNISWRTVRWIGMHYESGGPHHHNRHSKVAEMLRKMDTQLDASAIDFLADIYKNHLGGENTQIAKDIRQVFAQARISARLDSSHEITWGDVNHIADECKRHGPSTSKTFGQKHDQLAEKMGEKQPDGSAEVYLLEIYKQTSPSRNSRLAKEIETVFSRKGKATKIDAANQEAQPAQTALAFGAEVRLTSSMSVAAIMPIVTSYKPGLFSFSHPTHKALYAAIKSNTLTKMLTNTGITNVQDALKVIYMCLENTDSHLAKLIFNACDPSAQTTLAEIRSLRHDGGMENENLQALFESNYAALKQHQPFGAQGNDEEADAEL